MIKDDEADEGLLIALDQAKTPHGTVDNVMRVHSLRPSTMKGHLMLYRSCLHDSGNTIPEWLQEVISSYVSIINSCEYSLQNHWKNATHLINDEKKTFKIKNEKNIYSREIDEISNDILNNKKEASFPGTNKRDMLIGSKILDSWINE